MNSNSHLPPRMKGNKIRNINRTKYAVIGLAFTVVTLIFLDPILYFFGGSDATVGYARDYMVVILLGNVVTHLYLGLNAVLRSAGHPQKAMVATIATVVINTILDPVFIYGFGWGIQGAAIATITAQVIALAWQFKLFSNKEELLHFHKGIFRLKKKIVVDSLAIGMAPFLMNLAACFIVILINQGLQHHGGDLAIGAFGIVNRLVFLFVMIVMGLNQGMQPIAGYNYGAKQYPRVTKVLKITIYAATIVTTTGFLMGMFIPRLAVSIFTTHEELAEEIVSSAVVKFSKRFPDIKVEVDIPEEVVIVPMDPILIRQVIVNIMENAVIHGGSTTQVKVTVSANETEAIFSIEDNGKGIDGKILPMLFTGQISHREGETYDNKRSMGIGLSVCKSIIDAHRGKVWAENKIDGGAKISFTLPLEEEEQNGD